MAFALVRSIVNDRWGKRYIIPTINIRNYSKESPRAGIKYRMRFHDSDTEDGQGIIHDTHDDIDLLRQLLKKRLSTPTLNKCHTNLDDSMASAGVSKIAKKRTNDAPLKSAQQKRSRVKKSQALPQNEQFDLESMKKGRVPSKTAKNYLPDTELPTAGSSSEQENGGFDFMSTPAINVLNHTRGLETSTPKSSPTKGDGASDSLAAGADNTLKDNMEIVSSATNDLSQIEQGPESNMQQFEMTSNDSEKDDPNKTQNRTTSSVDTAETKSSEEGPLVQKLKKTISEYKKIIAKQNKTIEDYKKILQDRDDINRDLTKCNLDLQRTVINNFFELHDIVRDLKQSKPETVSPDGSHLSVGYLNRLNFMVHIGRGQWIEQKVWHYLFSLTKPTEFVREMATPVFTTAVLMNSTVKGRGSNRCGKGNIKNFDRLDPVKVEAIRGYSIDQFFP